MKVKEIERKEELKLNQTYIHNLSLEEKIRRMEKLLKLKDQIDYGRSKVIDLGLYTAISLHEKWVLLVQVFS